MTPLNLDPWWDEPYYKAAKGSFSSKGAFILRKLLKHDGAKFVEVMADLYRDDAPDPQDITKFEWEAILRYMGPARRRSPTCRSGWGGCGGDGDADGHDDGLPGQ
jgi:hypothetical protein